MSTQPVPAPNDLPAGWCAHALREVAVKIQDGTHFSPVLGGSEYKYITSKNIGPGIMKLDSVELISSEEHRKIYRRCEVRAGDVLLTKDGANTGNAAISTFREEVSLLSSVALIRTDHNHALESYLLQYILFSRGRRQIANAMSGNAITRLTLKKINDLVFPFPPVDEQRRIAAVLDDADALITSLDRLIIKQQAIRQGMMQQLLTGKTRLPGFAMPWSEVRIGDHVAYVKTVALSRAQLDSDSPVRYLHYGDIHTNSDVVLGTAETSMPRVSSALVGSAGRLQVGDVIFADASEDPAGVGKSVEITSVPPEGVVPGLHTIAARFNKGVLVDGFKAYLQFIPEFRNALLRLAAGTKVLATTRSYISSIVLQLPEVDEQLAITQALRDSDDEIRALRRRLVKARAVKQGMMEELLTGRTRLPVEEGAA